MTTEEKLESVLLNESPILFLGAGFSLGGVLKNSEPIPTGNGLKEHLIRSYLNLGPQDPEYSQLQNYNLDKVCEYIETIENKKKISDYILDYFRNVRPAEFHKKLLSYKWNKIYTVNIDDIVEKVCRDENVDILLHNSKIKSTLSKYGNLELFKLHGCVNNPSEGVTFSTQQYIDSMIKSSDYRFTSLSLDMLTRPVIILGATFDEINIDYYLKIYENAGYSSLRGSIFLINPNPPLLNTKKIEKLGGHILKWTTEEFLTYLNEKFQKGIPRKAILERDLRTYGFQDVDTIKKHLINEKKYTGNLYWGYFPRWEDVYYEWDFRFFDNEKKVSIFLERFENEQVAVLSFIGKVLSGKSVFLKRIALQLTKMNFKVLFFWGRSFDPIFLKRYISEVEHSNFAIIVDDASYFYSSIKRFIKYIPVNTKIRIFTVSRPYSHYRYRYQFVGENFLEVEHLPVLNFNFSTHIATKLEEKGYLGDLKKFSQLEDRAKVINNHGDIVSFLYSHSFGKGFKARFLRIVDNINLNDVEADLFICLSIFSKLELPYFPFELASLLFSEKLESGIDKLNDLVKEKDSDRLELRTAFIGEYFLTKVPNWKKIEILKSLLIFISPLINNYDQSYWNEIQASLIKEKYLRLRLKIKTDDIRQMLYDLRNYYSDDFNYWIQLGLTEQRRGDYEKALNHFKTAEALNETSYLVKNSIGRNYLKHAIAVRNEETSLSLYEIGEKLLLDLIRDEEEYKARAYASHSYLSESINYYDQFSRRITDEILRKMSKVLDYLLERDPDDPMTMEVNNRFIGFLKRHRKAKMFSYTLKDLKKLKPMFYDNFSDSEEFD